MMLHELRKFSGEKKSRSQRTMLAKRKIPQIGDIQMDSNNQEWIIVAITHAGLSRVKRNSLAHLIHATYSPEVAKSLTL